MRTPISISSEPSAENASPARALAANHAALAFLVDAAQVLALLLERALQTSPRDPQSREATTCVRDSLPAVRLCIDAMQGLLGAPDAAQAQLTLELLYQRLRSVWSRDDMNADVWTAASALLSSITWSGYGDFLDGDDRAFETGWKIPSRSPAVHASVRL